MDTNISLKLKYSIKVFGKSTLESMVATKRQEVTGN
jgi:hypothetical protein